MNPKQNILNTLKQPGVEAVSLNYFKRHYSAKDDDYGLALYELVQSGEIKEIKKYICLNCSNATQALLDTEFEDGELICFECHVCGSLYDRFETEDILSVGCILYYAVMDREDETNGNN